jgi:hypothetical protein
VPLNSNDEEGMSLVQRARLFLRSRQVSYYQTFNPNGQDTRVVLKDLAAFCRANKSTGHKDPYLAARLDGRREVWLRIQQHLQLSEDDLWRLYDGRPQPHPQQTGE